MAKTVMVIKVPRMCIICEALMETYSNQLPPLQKLFHLLLLKEHLEKNHPNIEIVEEAVDE